MLSAKLAHLIVFSVFYITCSESSLLNPYPKTKTVHLDSNADPGEPLILTPLIEAGNISDARTLSQVHLTGHNVENILSFSGYFTVNKTYNSNLFFWFFPAPVNPRTAPVILWLQGGPGASSLFGLFVENGPIQVTKEMELELNEYTWNMNHSVIYIDNPVGTGFSFTNSEAGYARDETMVGDDLYQALLQFFQLFPEFEANPFFIAGESYGGKYVPAASYAIHKYNIHFDLIINLQGLIIGNGFSDPGNQLDYSDYLYQLGLVDLNQKLIFQTAEIELQNLIESEDWEKAADKLDLFLGGPTTNGTSLFSNITKLNFYYNYLHSEDYTTTYWSDYVQREDVRRTIHVGNITFNSADDGGKVAEYLRLDMPQSIVPRIVELLDHYRILFYNGQLDIIVAYPLTENFLQKMSFSSSNEYLNAERLALYDDKDLIGYVKKAGNLTEVLVRNAGHMVPLDQPKSAYTLISRFIANAL